MALRVSVRSDKYYCQFNCSDRSKPSRFWCYYRDLCSNLYGSRKVPKPRAAAKRGAPGGNYAPGPSAAATLSICLASVMSFKNKSSSAYVSLEQEKERWL